MTQTIYNRGVRGATTVNNNEYLEIEESTIELLKEIIDKNEIEKDSISHVIFTLTHDLNAGFPAKAARIHLDWSDVPMICTQEIPVPNSLEKCIRVLIVINTTKKHKEIKHIYLRNAKNLRPDIVEGLINK
ncbi:MAG: chorismate mutase [Candidatus Gastranaerophilaceae bacterium]|jgi:chorismate mutase